MEQKFYLTIVTCLEYCVDRELGKVINCLQKSKGIRGSKGITVSVSDVREMQISGKTSYILLLW